CPQVPENVPSHVLLLSDPVRASAHPRSPASGIRSSRWKSGLSGSFLRKVRKDTNLLPLLSVHTVERFPAVCFWPESPCRPSGSAVRFSSADSDIPYSGVQEQSLFP